MNSGLFGENQVKLKSLFARLANREGHLQLPEFQIMLKNLKIMPTLLTPVNLKRHIDKIIKVSSSRAYLTFSQFEGLLKDICFSCFLSSIPSERAYLFFNHINDHSKSFYKLSFSTGSLRAKNTTSECCIRSSENSIDLDFSIKEALDILKSKDESFRSTHSAMSRELSPVPSLKSRKDNRSSDLRLVASLSSLHKRPYSNKSVPDSPNTSILGVRPSSRYHHKLYKDTELDEFLKTERLVESEVATVKVNLQNPLTKSSAVLLSKNALPPRTGISIKKIELMTKEQIVQKKSALSGSAKLLASVASKNLEKTESKIQRGGSAKKLFFKEETHGYSRKELERSRQAREEMLEKQKNFLKKEKLGSFSSGLGKSSRS